MGSRVGPVMPHVGQEGRRPCGRRSRSEGRGCASHGVDSDGGGGGRPCGSSIIEQHEERWTRVVASGWKWKAMAMGGKLWEVIGALAPALTRAATLSSEPDHLESNLHRVF